MFRASSAHLQEDTVVHMQHTYGTVTLYETSCWLVGIQLEWELTVGGRLLVCVLRHVTNVIFKWWWWWWWWWWYLVFFGSRIWVRNCVGLSVILHRAPTHLADLGKLFRYRGYWGNKIPRADMKIDLRQATQR